MTAPPTADETEHRPTWRQPVWMVGHVVAGAGIILFVLLGFWQWDRHQVRSELDAVLEERLAIPSVGLATLAGRPVDEIEFRRVIVTGEYDASEEVVWRARTLNGVSGHHVVTPLALEDERRILVDRGWVPIEFPDPMAPEAAPPVGNVVVEAVVRRPQTASGLGPADPPAGQLMRISRLIPERLEAQISGDLITEFYLQRSRIEAGVSDGSLPLLGATPAPGGGPPHLSYAVQWWVFALVVAVGYPILLLRTERKRRPTA